MSGPVPAPLRVRIHLNLAKPERAENAVKIQSPKTGAWITVAYATKLLLDDCVPVVEATAQGKIEQGSTRKVPHAFIEGDLTHFEGRIRAKAPPALVAIAKPHLAACASFADRCRKIQSQDVPINYNPRFARCFYRNETDRADISQRFEHCKQMAVVGWNFWAGSPTLAPLSAQDRCETSALAKTKISETLAIRRGRATTEELASHLSAPRPRALR